MAIQFAKAVASAPSPNAAKPVTNSVSNKAADKSRVAKWRAANPEAYRAYMREYMRKRRASD